MNKRTLQVIILLASIILLIVYGWNLFQRLSYNRLVFVTNVDNYIPNDAKLVYSFNRHYHLDNYFQLDTTNVYLLEAIKEKVTYPLVVAQFERGDDLLLMRATKEEEEQVKDVFFNNIALYLAPKVKRIADAELLFYTLPNNEFVTICFHKGILAISKDYMKVENFVINNAANSHFFDSSYSQQNYQVASIKEHSGASIFSKTDSTTYSFSLNRKDRTLILDGQYFGKLEHDSLKLSYNEMNSLLKLDLYYTDSIFWGEKNKIQIWLNKVEE